MFWFFFLVSVHSHIILSGCHSLRLVLPIEFFVNFIFLSLRSTLQPVQIQSEIKVSGFLDCLQQMDWFFPGECEFYMKKKKTDWLATLLRSKFFGSCVHHLELRKNEENVFCIDCNLGFCRHCTTAHCFHRRLQICKYVYHDVVRLQEMQKHLDCSKIQTYKINGEKAVHLNPRPQSKDAKPSTKSKFGGTCEACGRYLQDLPNRFCSIACKVSVISVKPKDQSNNFIDTPFKEICSQETDMNEMESSISMADSSEEIRAWRISALKPRKLLCKRKGIPRRAPFC